MDRQTATISASSSRNISKYEFLIGKDVLLENNLLEKRCYNQKIWTFSIRQRNNWNTQTDIAKKQYQGLDKVSEFDRKEEDQRINTKTNN